MKKILLLLFMLGYLVSSLKAQEDSKPGELTAKVKALSMYWFAKQTEFKAIKVGVPVRIYFFGDQQTYDYISTGKLAAINGSEKILAFYDNGKNTNRDFLSKCQFVLIDKGQEYKALAILREYGPKTDCWIITQQDKVNGKYPLVYAKNIDGQFLLQNGKKVQNNIFSMGSMVNLSQHPSFGFDGNKDLIKKSFKSVSGQLLASMRVIN